MKIKFIRMKGNKNELPKVETTDAAGLDLRANEDLKIPGGNRAVISTGFKVELPPGNVGQIWPRSGLAVNKGIDVLAGVIDPDYRGEVKVALLNTSAEDFEIKKGDRIAQLLVVPLYPNRTAVEVQEVTESKRGAGGFGSTGKK